MEEESIALIIGNRVLASQARHRQYVAEHAQEWQDTGTRFRNARDALNISRRQMRPLIGISEATIARFERGRPIKARTIVEAAYRTALNLVQLQREQSLANVNRG